MSEKTTPEHLDRLAVVYIRQSSPGQVKNHPESYRVQKGLTARAEQLGWSKEKIRVVQGDQGSSASSHGDRDHFNDVLEMVHARQFRVGNSRCVGGA